MTPDPITISVRRFPWISRLASDYAFAFDAVAEFFAGNPADPAAWRDAIARVSRNVTTAGSDRPRRRDLVADVLHAQQTRRGAPPAAVDAAAALRDPRTVAVVTGQQAGVFGGPLYTLLKALTAIQLAQKVRAEHGVPAIAIFWIDAEDHDWDEVKSCGLLDVDDHLATVSLDDAPGANQRPVGGLILDGSVEQAIETLARTLAQTDFSAALIDQIRRAYAPGASVSHAFGCWLEDLLGPRGLVLVDSSDPDVKPLLADLFAAEVTNPGRTSRLAAEAGAALEQRGYHAQVTPPDGSVALFHLDGGRRPIRHDAGRFLVGDEAHSPDTLAARVREHPETFSPNVLLRPLAQDTLFPTICYVAGPSELAYLAQLRGVYEAFGVPMPLVQPRASATILDANAMRFLAKHDVPFEALRVPDESVLNQLLADQLPPSVETSLETATRAITDHMEAVARAVPAIDPTLEGAVRSAMGRMHDDLKKLHAKIIQGAKRKDETLRRQFKHAQAQAFPGGHPQERTIGFVYFLNTFGPMFVDRLAEAMPIEMGNHCVIAL